MRKRYTAHITDTHTHTMYIYILFKELSTVSLSCRKDKKQSVHFQFIALKARTGSHLLLSRWNECKNQNHNEMLTVYENKAKALPCIEMMLHRRRMSEKHLLYIPYSRRRRRRRREQVIVQCSYYVIQIQRNTLSDTVAVDVCMRKLTMKQKLLSPSAFYAVRKMNELLKTITVSSICRQLRYWFVRFDIVLLFLYAHYTYSTFIFLFCNCYCCGFDGSLPFNSLTQTRVNCRLLSSISFAKAM